MSSPTKILQMYVPFYLQTALCEVKIRTAGVLLLTTCILLNVYFDNFSSSTSRILFPEWLANLMLPLFLTLLKFSHQTLLWELCMQVGSHKRCVVFVQ